MKGFRGLSLALVTALLVPATALAQQKPKDTKYTKDAAKFIGLALMRQDPAERTKMYQDALTALQEGFTADAENPKFWLIAGQAYAGLGDLQKADEAFDKAVQMHPDYAEEIVGERESGWVTGFTRGVELMDQQQYEQAIAVFEAANELYGERPEGYLNLGNLYANTGDIPKAIAALEKAIETASGPMLEKLDSAGKAQWIGYQELARVNISQMRGGLGVEAFEKENFKEAEALFRQASQENPHSRDFLFNIVQARYAQAAAIEERIEADSSIATQVAPELRQLYEGLKADIDKVQDYDPNNENLYMILARSQKRMGELAGDTAAAQQGALAVLTELQNLPVGVAELVIAPGGEADARISGAIKNKNLAVGTPVTIRLTLLDRAGATVGEQQIVVNAPEKDQTATFEATAPYTGTIAGWKYQVVVAS